jgi:hypothetical protein
MRVSYALNVLNGEPFIWYQLKSIYEHAHEIVLVEGAYKKFAHAARGFRSADDTIKIIKNYPDPEKKIKLITRDYYYDDRVGMCNEFMADLTGDILWQVDVDEFYSNKTHRYVKQLFDKDEELDQISFNFVDYYGGFEYVIEGYDDSLLDVIRVNRIYPGMRWFSQRPPKLELNGNELIPREQINGKEMRYAGHLMHNATMLFDNQVRDKFEYYANMWPKGVIGSRDWYVASWKNFEIKFCVAGMRNTLTYLVPRTSALPEGLEEMHVDISSGKSVGYRFSSQKIKSKIAQDQEYERKILAAKAINRIKSSSLVNLIPRVIDAIFLLSPLLQSGDKKFMRSILLRSIKGQPYLALRRGLKNFFKATASRG